MIVLAVVFAAGCAAEAAPPKPTARVTTGTVPPAERIAVTADELERVDPCDLLVPATLQDDSRTIWYGTRFTGCEVTFAGQDDTLKLYIDFDFAFRPGAELVPSDRAGITVYSDADTEKWCGRGIPVAKDAAITLYVGGAGPDVTCPAVDRVLDGTLAILVNGVPEAERAPESLDNQDACRVLRHVEAFEVPGSDQTQYTPGFAGQTCVWGDPREPHVSLSFGPSLPLEKEPLVEVDRETTIDGHDALVLPRAGRGDSLPGCSVLVDYRPLDKPDSIHEIERIDLMVIADQPYQDSCALAEKLAKSALKRLPA